MSSRLGMSGLPLGAAGHVMARGRDGCPGPRRARPDEGPQSGTGPATAPVATDRPATIAPVPDSCPQRTSARRHQPSPLSRWGPAAAADPADASNDTNLSNRYAASWGPAAASGWYCTLNALSPPSASRSSNPSTTSSLRQTWLTVASPYGVVVGPRRGASTAKPWLCAVTSTLPVVRSITGWLTPRWPYFSL